MTKGRINLTVVVCGDNVYAIGGENARGNALNSIERISIKSLLTEHTTANNNRTTSAWQTFHCCMSMPRAFANAVSIQDRYIVVAGGRSNAVVGQNRSHRERRVLASVEIIDTHFPYLSMPYSGPSLICPRYSFGMGVVILHPLRGVGRLEEGLLTPRRAIAPRSGPPSKSASADLAVHDEELLPAEESIAPTSAPTTRRGCRLLL